MHGKYTSKLKTVNTVTIVSFTEVKFCSLTNKNAVDYHTIIINYYELNFSGIVSHVGTL